MRVHFSNFDHLRIKLQSSDFFRGTKFHALLFLLPSSSYPWLSMVVSFFLTHLILEVASPIIFLSCPFRCHCSSRSKGLHWWRISKAYKLHMELRQLLPLLLCSLLTFLFFFSSSFSLESCSSTRLSSCALTSTKFSSLMTK